MRIPTHLLALVLSLAALAAVATEEPTNNAPAGIGAILGMEGHNIIVKDILLDSPAGAARADFHEGDRIIAVAQGEEPAVQVEGRNLAQVVSLIRGLRGTTVSLTIVHAGEDESHAQVVSFVRGELNLPAPGPAEVEFERKQKAAQSRQNHPLRLWLMGGLVVLAGLGMYFQFSRRKSG